MDQETVVLNSTEENKEEANLMLDIYYRIDEKERSYWKHFLKGVRYGLELAKKNQSEDEK